MPDILISGQWEHLTLAPQGAIQIGLVSPVPARLEVVGTSTAPKYLGASRDVAAFPARAVTQDRPVTVRAVTTTGDAFPGDCVVDLSLDAGQGAQAHLIRGIPVAGQLDAPLIQMRLDDGVIRVRPGEGGSATLGLGGWCVRRREEAGAAIVPTVTELVVDTSASMQRHDERVAAVEKLLEDLYDAAQTPRPSVRRAGAGGSTPGGVGAVNAEPAPQGRTVLLTDLPAVSGQCECLVIGDPALAQALPPAGGAPYLIPDEAAWNELLREDVAFSSQTLSALTPLLDWLCRPASTNGVAS